MNNNSTLNSLMLGSQPGLGHMVMPVEHPPIVESLPTIGTVQTVPSVPATAVSQRPIAQEQFWESVSFPRGDQVVTTPDGVFIPSSVFGEKKELRYRIQASHDVLQVIVFPESNGGGATPDPTAELNNEAEQKWISEHRSTHAGQWIALSGYRLLASGPDPASVYQQARLMGIPVPFIEYLNPEEDLPFAGW